jgi:hypothetical protein
LGIVEVVYRCTCGVVHVQRERRNIRLGKEKGVRK